MSRSQPGASALRVELLKEQLLQRALPLEHERTRAMIEAQPGATANALQCLGIELQIEQKHRLERLQAVLVGRIGHERPTGSITERSSGQLRNSGRHFTGEMRVHGRA